MARWSLVVTVFSLARFALGSGDQLPLVDQSSIPISSDAPSYREQLLDLHKALVSIPSTSGLESAIGGFLVEELLEYGWQATLQFVPPRNNTPELADRFNVIAWPSADIPDPKVLLTSHIDTVPPHIPYSIEDGDVNKNTRISGRGSVDAKASVAAMIVAVDELLKKGDIDKEDVMLLFVVGEEVSGDGMRAFSDSHGSLVRPAHFEAVIFGEPTEGKLACGHKGALFCTLGAQGVAAHSGYPWLGKSANELIVRAMVRLFDTDLGSSEEFGNTTVNLGRMEGGIAENVIPEHAYAGIMTRVAIGPEDTGGNIVYDRIHNILKEVDEDAFDLDCHQSYGFVKANCDVEGFETTVANYGTDMPHLKGDHTRYLYGPGSILVAHGAHENITVGDLESAVEGYQKLVLHSLKD